MGTVKMNYSITYTKRKTIAIYIHKDGFVEVRCNKSTPKSAIEKFVDQKQKWIYEKVAVMLNKIEIKNDWKIEVGNSLLFMGKEYPIISKEGNNVGFDGQNFYIPPQLDHSYIQSYIIGVYKTLAKKVIIDKVKKYADIMGVTPANVKINSAKTRWGSCSGKNSLNFSWLLVMAEESVIEYVVVHELSHIKEHNHSERFWKIVADVFPDYKMKQRKLKVLQEKLSNEDW